MYSFFEEGLPYINTYWTFRKLELNATKTFSSYEYIRVLYVCSGLHGELTSRNYEHIHITVADPEGVNRITSHPLPSWANFKMVLIKKKHLKLIVFKKYFNMHVVSQRYI